MDCARIVEELYFKEKRGKIWLNTGGCDYGDPVCLRNDNYDVRSNRYRGTEDGKGKEYYYSCYG